MTKLEIDFFENATDSAMQLAYVTNATDLASQYPIQDADHVKATSTFAADYYPYFATDPTKSLVYPKAGNCWEAGSGVFTNQRFHIDLGSAKIITRIYYENYHNSSIWTTNGVKNFTFWGSNTAGAFAELTYAINTDWTQITPAQSTFDQHAAADAPDPKYITVTNTTAYRYYAFKFADNWGGGDRIGVQRIELQALSPSLQSYSEATIKTQGSYALKGIAAITDSLNKTLTKTLSPTYDLSGVKNLSFDMGANRTGANVKIGLHDSGGTTTEITPNIITADAFQKVNMDLSNVSDANKDAIDKIILTQVNADSATTYYIDNFKIEQAIDVFGII